MYSDVPCPASTQENEVLKRHTEPSRAARPLRDEATGTETRGAGAMAADALMQKFGKNDYDAYLLLKITGAEKVRAATKQEGASCLEQYRNTFRDPQSAYVVTAVIMQDGTEKFTLTDVSATNGFGGKTRSSIVCTFNGE
jgi:hypothetical protein